MIWKKTAICLALIGALSGCNLGGSPAASAAPQDLSGDPFSALPDATSAWLAQLEPRTADGSGNNLAHPDWGSANQPFLRHTTLGYGDGVGTMGGSQRPNPRDISNAVNAQIRLVPNRAHVSDLIWQWGQFLDHDITLIGNADPAEHVDIPIPAGEPLFDPAGTGTQVLPLLRSEHMTMPDGHREQMNHNTAFVDASMVYGSNDVRAAALRANDGTGHLRSSEGNLLPFNDKGQDNAGPGGGNAPGNTTLFLGGDVRVNEQVGLTAMQTLWMREHNRLADRISAREPWLTDDQIYQGARELVIAEIEKITYRDFLPILVGRLTPYRGYDETVNPGIENLFAAALYRVGHTLLSPQLLVLAPDGTPIIEGGLSLRDAFFTPDQFIRGGLMEPLLRGQATQVAQEVDCMVVDPVRNFLFGKPGQGGLDLPSINIQRGREHGLPGYAQARLDMGLSPATSFADISSDPEVQQRLASVYASVDDVDPWVGAISEDHVEGALVGELIATVVRDQFQRLRDGDRFYYENALPRHLVRWVNHRTLSKVIRDNTGIGSELQRNAFFAP